jgi:inhibitor of growth protein 3
MWTETSVALMGCYVVLTEKRRDSNASTVSTEKRLAIEKPTVTIPEPRPLSASSGSLPTTPLPTTTTNVSYNLGHIGAGGNAIAAAASQAIAATQQVLTLMEVSTQFLFVYHSEYAV